MLQIHARQKTRHGYQPVHYVSRTLTDTKGRYSQIERETLTVEFVTSRLQMYLLGGKNFQLATDHKPLPPLFNNPQAKLPPRIERLITKMQNLDFTSIHIPGKENVTDYMSRHLLPGTAKTGVEKHVKAVTELDHAVVLQKIAAASAIDPELKHLKQAIKPEPGTRKTLYSSDTLNFKQKFTKPKTLFYALTRSSHQKSGERRSSE